MINITQWILKIEKNMKFGSNFWFRALSVKFVMASIWSLGFFNTVQSLLEFEERRKIVELKFVHP
jgi:hypothetical protein